MQSGERNTTSGSKVERLRPERYPMLPDALYDDVSPAPDGHPWLKACNKCAFRSGTEQHACTGMDKMSATYHDEPTAFYCVHRLDGEHHRVCACWAACRAALASSESKGSGDA